MSRSFSLQVGTIPPVIVFLAGSGVLACCMQQMVRDRRKAESGVGHLADLS